jgi:hypothetical protein
MLMLILLLILPMMRKRMRIITRIIGANLCNDIG